MCYVSGSHRRSAVMTNPNIIFSLFTDGQIPHPALLHWGWPWMLHGWQLPPSSATQGSLCPCFFQVILPPPLLPFLSCCPLPLVRHPEFSFMQWVPKHTYLSLSDFKLITFSGPIAFSAGHFSCKVKPFQDLHFCFTEAPQGWKMRMNYSQNGALKAVGSRKHKLVAVGRGGWNYITICE